ncbi:MAG: S49 family peptidase [Phycisphaerales bacterium]|nr:S49 family peptidase [Phycisphaerales bacterium]
MKRRLLSAALLSLASIVPMSLAQPADGTKSGPRVVTLDIEGAMPERPGAMDWLMEGDAEPTLREVINALHDAATSDKIDAILVRLKDPELKVSQIEELGAAIGRVRAAGKKVIVFGEAYGNTELLLGSYTDRVIAQAGGPLSMPGMYMEEMFLADTLAWAGLKADMVQIGDYKGASEQMGRAAPSPQWDKNINQLLDSQYANLREQMKRGRKLTDQQLDAAMETSWMIHAEQATSLGLVDSVVDLPNLSDDLAKHLGGTVAWSGGLIKKHSSDLAMDNPFAILQKLSQKPKTSPDGTAIAVLHIDGVIVDGDSSSGGLFGGETNVGSRTIRNAIEDILEDDNFKGCIVRIDSPGGSATASEVMWQGLRRLAAKKPVWVSVGSMAASGGYYCAVAADKIYVNPSSIVGSIGVVGGKIAMQGLYEKVKVNVVTRSRGPRAAMFRSTAPWSPEEIELVRGKMKETYDLFTSRVTAGRRGIDLGMTAEGRLFSGSSAVGLKMADKVGGLSDAIADMADSLSISEYEVMDLPGPKPLEEVIRDAMKGFASAPIGGKAAMDPIAKVASEIVGPHAWPALRDGMNAMLLLREQPVILMTPSVIVAH